MGCLESLDKLTSVVRRDGFDVFIETGCGKGASLAYAAKFDFFKELYSAEIVESLATEAKQKFKKDIRVVVVNSESASFLAMLLPMLNLNQKILFFLDAHWPGLDFGRNCGKFRDDISLPLRKELEAIWKLRYGKDTVIIDDLRIYEDGPFPSGNIKNGEVPVFHESRSSQFVDDLFRETHIVERIFQDEGYMILTPKGV